MGMGDGEYGILIPCLLVLNPIRPEVKGWHKLPGLTANVNNFVNNILEKIK